MYSALSSPPDSTNNALILIPLLWIILKKLVCYTLQIVLFVINYAYLPSLYLPLQTISSFISIFLSPFLAALHVIYLYAAWETSFLKIHVKNFEKKVNLTPISFICWFEKEVTLLQHFRWNKKPLLCHLEDIHYDEKMACAHVAHPICPWIEEGKEWAWCPPGTGTENYHRTCAFY